MIFIIASLLLSVECTIIAVIQVSRHGARAPTLAYPWDKGIWPEGYGELTAEGMRQHYLNGVEFRRRYLTTENVISKTFDATQVYIRSTDVNRTIVSAQAQLMGLFPDGPDIRKKNKKRAVPPIDIEGLEWIIFKLGNEALPNLFSPVPVHVVPIQEDSLLLGFYPAICPKIAEIMQETMQGEDYKERLFQYNTYLKPKLVKIFNENVEFSDVANYADVLITQKFHGFDWPKGVTHEIFEEMEGIYNYSLSLYFQGQAKDLASNEFYRSAVRHFLDVIGGNSTQRWWHFSAHDATLVGFLSVLEAYNGFNPPFASTLLFELGKDREEFYVNVKYNDVSLSVPGCTGVCSFSQFQQFVESWSVDDINSACASSSGENISAAESLLRR